MSVYAFKLKMYRTGDRIEKQKTNNIFAMNILKDILSKIKTNKNNSI